jgi:hypothetical protein
MNNKLERTQKEAAVVYFEVLSQYLPIEIEENMKNLGQDSWCPN